MRIGILGPLRREEDCFLASSEALFQVCGGNTGNFAFVEAIYRHCAPNAGIFPWHVSREEAREKCDVLLFAAANQLGAHNDLGWLASRFEAIGLPVVALGLGAQAPDLKSTIVLPAGTDRWIRTVAALAPNRRPNIGVRGEFTREQLERLGLDDRAVVIGCPSNFLNHAPEFYQTLARNVQTRSIQRIGVAAGHRHFAGAVEIERTLAEMVTQTGGAYIVQASLDMLRLSRNEFDLIDPAEFEALRQFVAPDLDADGFRVWCKRNAICFSDATSWLEALRCFDFVVGARYHGVMLAIQAGTPGGVIAHDSRTLELCETTAIPARRPSETPRAFAAADLFELFPFNVAQYASRREELRQRYVELLTNCGIAPNARLKTPQKYAA